ncbi:MAG: AAA family ATPase [Planctomycetota bacterium]
MAVVKPKRRPTEFGLILDKVRCFAREQVIPIRPLTLLVGENSSGKTTVLAATSVVLGYGFPMRTSFNEPPFQLGSFDTIATYKGGKYGRAKEFSLGYKGSGPNSVNVRATYAERLGEPAASSIRVEMPSERLLLVVEFGEKEAAASLKHEGKQILRQTDKLHAARLYDLQYVLWFMAEGQGKKLEQKVRRMARALVAGRSVGPGKMGTPFLGGVVPMAPVRSRPRRTYSEISSDYKPEGDHVPFVLSRLPKATPRARAEESVAKAIAKYGKMSGLFDKVSSKRLGKKLSSPFQILVKGAGPAANLVDVGYGVSQALPIVVQTLLAEPYQYVLIQQPEVHLHPQAQAALGSFFAESVGSGKRHLMVETHSDYIVDRVRMEVAAGKLRPDQVVILYFEKKNLESKVFPIHLDKHGNMLDAPRSYRSFFLKERTAFIKGKR